jgi:hypothetical protein
MINAGVDAGWIFRFFLSSAQPENGVSRRILNGSMSCTLDTKVARISSLTTIRVQEQGTGRPFPMTGVSNDIFQTKFPFVNASLLSCSFAHNTALRLRLCKTFHKRMSKTSWL